MEKKQIGERIKFSNTKNEGLIIEINQKTTLLKKLFLIFWLLLILIAGYLIMQDYFALPNESEISMERIMYMASIALWLFFFYKIGKVLLWRFFGTEVITLSDGLLKINNKYGKYGKPQKFSASGISKFKGVERNNDLVKGYFNYEFLTTGGERFEFQHNKKEYIFGKQISDKDTHTLGRIINDALKKEQRKSKN